MQTACLLFITKVVDGDEGLCLQDGGGGEQRDQLLPAHPAGAPGLAGLNSPPQRWASVARRAASPQFMKPFLLLNLVAFLHVFIFSWSCCHIFVPCISAPGSERWPGVGGLPCPGLLHALAPRPAPPAGRWSLPQCAGWWLHVPPQVSEYWVAVCLAGYRSVLVFSLSFIMYKVTGAG